MGASLLAGFTAPLSAQASPLRGNAPLAPLAPRTASEQAAATGEPVEVTSETTETTQVMANPDGSFTLRSNREPVRTQQDGQWVPIDTTLSANPDGTLSPAATTAHLTFSGGGTGPAVTIADPDTGNKISFSWPTALPAPSIDGDTATYPDVLPGVDLQLTAKSDSYSEVVVVHDATAAANPALSQLHLHADAVGLSLDKASDGGLTATDDNGNTVFDGTAPLMWDSTTNPQVGATPTADNPGSAKLTPLPVSVPTADGTSGSAATTVTLTPPTAALTGPDVHYPVYLDPVLSNPHRQNFAVVLSNGAPYYNDSSQDLKVGYCNWAECNNIAVGRSYFDFDTTSITRNASYQDTTAHIFAAKIDAYEYHNAAGCTTEPVDLWSAGGISGSTVWPGPALSYLTSATSNAGDTCSTSPAGNVDFTNTTTNTALLDRVQSAANSGTTRLTFFLRAPDETDRNQWKRFATDPLLTVTYNFPPSGASATGITNPTSCQGKVYTADNTPTLNGLAHDNNNPHTDLDLRFNVYPAGGSQPRASSADVAEASDRAVASWPVSSVLPDGDWEYTIKAHFASANTYIDIWSGESPRYAFTVLHTPPAIAPRLFSTSYPPNYWGAATSHPGSFTVNANGASKILGFQYVWDRPGQEAPSTCAPVAGRAVAAAASGTATIPVPSGESVGLHTLYVVSYNAAMAQGPEASYSFYVAPDSDNSGANRVEAEDPSLSWGATSSQTMTDFFRYLGNGDHASAVGGVAPGAGYTSEQGLGLLSTTPATGTVALYDCLTGTDHFTSGSSTCEGKTMVRTLGYIYSAKPGSPSTHRVYRCLGSEHFDSYDPGCEGKTVESVLGYAMDLPASGAPSLDGSSAGYQLRLVAAAAANQQFTMSFTPTVEADYAFGGEFYTGPSNARLSFAISDNQVPTPTVVSLGNDGTPGSPINTYSSVAGEHYFQLGGAHLQANSQYTLIVTVDNVSPSTGYVAGIDYLTIAPVTALAATPNNHGIAKDNTTTTADFDGNGDSLSADALQAVGIKPGATYQTGAATFRIPDTALNGDDNILSRGGVLPLNKPLTGAAHLYLLVANTGPVTPADDFQYTVSTIDGADNATDHQLPAIPNWLTGDSSTATSSGTDGGIRTLAQDLPYYDHSTSATPVNTHVYLYLISIPINPSYVMTKIVLPPQTVPGSSTSYALHVLAVTTA